METLRFILIAICTILLFTRCTKEVNKSSRSIQSSISAPALIFGKWNLVNEDDTTFYSERQSASSWCFKNWFYNFGENGILEISNNDITDSFTYYFSDKDCVNISWVGWPNNICTDTVINLTETAYVFKHWENNPDNSKTKQVFYLSK